MKFLLRTCKSLGNVWTKERFLRKIPIFCEPHLWTFSFEQLGSTLLSKNYQEFTNLSKFPKFSPNQRVCIYRQKIFPFQKLNELLENNVITFNLSLIWMNRCIFYLNWHEKNFHIIQFYGSPYFIFLINFFCIALSNFLIN